MTQTKTDRPDLPVDEPVDREVISFRAQFDQRSSLDEIVKEGAKRMLQVAIDAEVESFIAMHADRTDERDRRHPVPPGRVHDNDPDPGNRLTFSPSVLLSYLRKTKAIEELIPWLYLKGISPGDFDEAFQSLVGERAAGLSPNVMRCQRPGVRPLPPNDQNIQL